MNQTRKIFSKRKVVSVLLTAILVSLFCSLPASAASAVRVTVNGRVVVNGRARIVNSATYVPFRAFANETVSGSSVSWKASTRTATMKSAGTTITATVGKSGITSNGAWISSSAKNLLIGGTLFVPVRPIAAAIGYTVKWDGRTYTAALTKAGSTSGGGASSGSKPTYSENDLYWLSRIIEAEAGGEPYRGKLAVGTVIMNRVKSKTYPNTIYGVIFDRKNGIQFTPAATGSIYNVPSSSSVKAAKEILGGSRISGNIQYFLNPALASDRWFRNNLTYVCTIGSHAFYAP